MADQQYPEGQYLQGSDGKVYVVRGGVPVLEEAIQAEQERQLRIDQLRANLAKSQQPQAPAGWRPTANGGLEPIPGGPADPNRPQPRPTLTKQQTGAARQKLQGLRAIDAQLTRVENALTAAEQRGFTGPLWGNIPGTGAFDAESSVLDKSISQLAPLIRQLTRTPGEGSMSDYESRLAAMALPKRSDNPAAVREAIAGIRDLISQTAAGYSEMLGEPEQNQRREIAPGAGAGGGALPSGGNGGQDLSQVPSTGPVNVMDQRQAAGAGATEAAAAVPQEMQDAHARYLAQHWGRVDPQDYAAFRTALDRQFGYSGNPADYAASVASINDFARRGGAPQQAFVPDLKKDLSPLARARNDFVASPMGAGLTAALNSATLGVPGMLAPGQRDAMEALQPGATTLGNIAGGIPAAAAMELGLGAAAARMAPGMLASAVRSPLLADAAYGATTAATNGDNPLLGAMAGTGGGVVGRNAARGVGNALGGVRDAGVQTLRNAGVPLTLGQAVGQGGIVGRTIKGIEDRFSGIPLVGDIVNARRREGIEGFNRAAFDEGLAPVGGTTNGVTGAQGVDAARRVRSDAYGAALNGQQFTADAPFIADMQATIDAANRLPETMRGNALDTLRMRVGESFDNAGNLSGNDFQQSLRGLRRDASSFEDQPYGYDFGNVTRQAESGLRDMVARQAPDVLPAYDAANAANRNVSILQDATNRARNGTRSGETDLFMPSQLADAAAANARRFGGTQGTTQQPFYDLSRAGQRVLPNAVPDSGTAGRLLLGSLALGGAGAGAGNFGGDSTLGRAADIGSTVSYSGAATLGALAALGSRPAQRALVSLVADRPDLAVRVGENINRYLARPGGIFGAAAVPALTQ